VLISALTPPGPHRSLTATARRIRIGKAWM